ncbi:MAG TPA: hypothetical protein VGC66_20435 [Pyrinomonadaceae bacterium]|jgi:hypothetical protein
MRWLSPSIHAKRWLGLISILILTVATVCLILTSRELYAAIRTQDVNVTAQKQVGSPITLEIISVTSSNPKEPVFSYDVINTGSKTIKAYAIRNDVTVGSDVNSGVTYSYMHEPSAFLYPGTRRLESFGSVTYGGDVSKVVLSVDYVEFEDGATWGDDIFKISEKFAGQREGYRAAIKKLRENFKSKGRGALLSALENDFTDLYPQADKPQQWKDGFNNGLKIARSRLKYIHKNGGVSALEYELEKPLEETPKEQ